MNKVRYFRAHILLQSPTQRKQSQVQIPAFALFSEQVNIREEGVLILIDTFNLEVIVKKKFKMKDERMLAADIVSEKEILIAWNKNIEKRTFPELEIVSTKELTFCNYMQYVDERRLLVTIEQLTIVLMDRENFEQICYTKLQLLNQIHHHRYYGTDSQKVQKMHKTKKSQYEFLICFDIEISFLQIQGNQCFQNLKERYSLKTFILEVIDCQGGNKLLVMAQLKVLVINRKKKQIERSIISEHFRNDNLLFRIPFFAFSPPGRFPYLLFVGNKGQIVKISLISTENSTEEEEIDCKLANIILSFQQYREIVHYL